MKTATCFAAVLALSTFAACGGGSDDAPDARITITPDANTGTPDAPPANCLTATSHGTVTPGEQLAEADDLAAPTFLGYQALLNADTAPDIIGLELYDGLGALAGGIAPGTYTIAGDDLNYISCGLCVRIFTDATETEIGSQYLATGGTVTITQVTPNIQGTMSNITTETVTIAPDFTSTPVGDGCTSAVTSLAFDAAVTMQAP